MLSICGNLKDEALSKGLIFELDIYVGEYMAMAYFMVFDHQLLDVGLEVCGRAGQDLAKQDISCVNIQIFLLGQSHSGEPEKLLYHTLRSDLHCMFSETNISYRADRLKLCFGQTC